MILIPGYDINEVVFDCPSKVAFRAVRKSDLHPVILKVSKFNGAENLPYRHLDNECTLLSTSGLKGLLKNCRKLRLEENQIVEFDDFEGINLEAFLANTKTTLAEKFQIALNLSSVVKELHNNNILHRDIRPLNFLIQPNTFQLKCIDLSVAVPVNDLSERPHLNEKFSTALAYLSPEQTGRLSIVEDTRSDLYSLGITLYQLFTGQCPFQTTDLNEMVHAHLAKQAVLPHLINPEIPQSLSQIILKLLEKKPEARYQHAKALMFDLLKSLDQCFTPDEGQSFVPGENDQADRFEIPSMLYGFERELELLLHVVEKPGHGSEIVLVYGNSGIGKSALISQVCRKLASRQVFFISGKCDQYLQQIPYGAVTTAFKQLVSKLLKQPQEKVQHWRELILNAVGEFGQLIVDEIPELESLIGKQPKVPGIPSADAINRSILVFSNFINVFAQPEHPLVIALDNLQWADTGTLAFIESVTRESKSLIIIGAYRDNELTPEHPLKKTIDNLKKAGAPLKEVGLMPLNIVHIQELLSDTLSCPLADAAPLAELVFTRTLGNPLFITEYLNSLYRDCLIHFNKDDNKWTWSLSQVQEHTKSASSIELITRKIQRLSANSRQALSYAACIGNVFNLEVLAALLDKPNHDTAEDLKECVHESLIIPVKSTLNSATESFYSKIQYNFLHNQIRQAAYALIADELKEELHLSIGYIFLDKSSTADVEKNCFEIVSHLNDGRSLITDVDDVFKIAGLNLIAGKKAKSTTAFDVAFEYFGKGLEYMESSQLTEKKWDTYYYPLTLALHMQAAETAFLTGRFEKSASLINQVLSQTKTLKEKIDAVLLQIQSLIYQKENEKAIALAQQTLQSLGVSLPHSGSNVQILTAYLKCKWILGRKKIEDLEHLPAMQNQEILEAFRVIQTITATTYLTSPKLYPLLVLKMVYLSVKYGNAPQSSLAYATYGAIVNAIQTDNEACFRFGQLAVKLQAKIEDKALIGRTLLVYNLINRVSKEHIHNALEPLKKTVTAGIESGEMEYAVYASSSYCVLLMLSGKNLNWVKDEMLSVNTLPKNLQPQLSSAGNEALIQIISNFLGESPNPKTLTGQYFNEEEGFIEIFKTNHRSKIFVCHLYKSIFCYLLEDYPQAFIHMDEATRYLLEAKGMVLEPLLYFYKALLYFSIYSNNPKKKTLAVAIAYKKKLKKWAVQVPVNHAHRFLLVEAEHFRVINDARLASEYYDKAIKLSKENNHCHEEALASELAGKYWLSRGQQREAAVYLTGAVESYKKWGCKLKSEQLLSIHGSVLSAGGENFETSRHTIFITNNSTVAATFDLATLMKASIAISSEVVFDKLMEKLMKVVIENAGAQVGYFILERFGTLFIEAKQSVEEEKVILLKTPLHQSRLVPEAIIQYVFDSKENVLIHDAKQDEQFKNEFQLSDERIKSILCIPTMNQGKLVGVLYLENNLTTGAFTTDRVELLKLLSGQIAVSIENAILYENLEQKVEERTKKIQIQKEEIERQKQLVEEKSRYKEQFFANMSHEIRTPMTAIIGMSELIYGTPLNPQQTEYAKGIKYSSENLLSIINDILDYSKIEAGKFSFVKKPFQIKERVNRLGYILQCMAEDKGVELMISVDDNISGQLIGDPLRLHQILLNLASNAIKFTDNGSVEISVEKIGETDTNEELLFKVKDTGIGIPEEKLQYIFETFSQIEEEASIQHSGTGLGLFIAKKLVEEQGGKMEVKSKLKHGTEFQFNLFFDKSSVYQIQKKDSFEKNLRGLNILLVEDNLFNQVVVEELLKIMIPEVRVTIADNGAVAVEKLAGQAFDIVLMDVKMPVMDGYKATKTIREGSVHNKVPILALTANASPLEAEKCKAAGMDDYLSKPIESQKLKEKIAKLVNYQAN